MPLTSRFLAHLNHRLELACPLSVVVVVVVLHFRIFLYSLLQLTVIQIILG